MDTEFFEPRISADTALFWDGCRQHRLLFQRCTACGRVRWPASYVCPDCLSEASETVELPPQGTLYSYVVMHKPFHPSLGEKVPYVVGEVDLRDGVRITVNMEDEPQALRCGMPVEIVFHDSSACSRPMARRIENK